VLRDHGGDDDVVVMLDGDDWLAEDHALARVSKEYEAGWEVVWSNWRGSDGRPGTSFHLHPFISPRLQPFVSSHLFTFRKRLFHALDERDFQDDDGEWLRQGCDVALALPLLDQTIRAKHIEDVLVVYNVENPLSVCKSGTPLNELVSEVQAATSRMLCSRPAKDRVQDPGFLHEHLYELLHAASMSSLLLAARQTESLLAERFGGRSEDGACG
jgi:hypothetical protein